MSAPIQVPVTLDSANRKKDKSVRLSFTTNFEVSTEDYMQMDRLVQSAGWLLFSPNELQDADIPTERAPTEEGKSKGQRMRAVCYLRWKQETGGDSEPFEPWYDRKFEALLDHMKAKLD